MFHSLFVILQCPSTANHMLKRKTHIYIEAKKLLFDSLYVLCQCPSLVNCKLGERERQRFFMFDSQVTE